MANYCVSMLTKMLPKSRTSLSLAMADEPGKRHNVHAHNCARCFGLVESTLFADIVSDYIENVA